jgi:acyl carrier protein
VHQSWTAAEFGGSVDLTRTEFKALLEDLFGVPHGSLRDGDSRDTIKGWSSLVDVQILALLSSELGVEIDPEEFSYETVGELVDQLQTVHAFS